MSQKPGFHCVWSLHPSKLRDSHHYNSASHSRLLGVLHHSMFCLSIFYVYYIYGGVLQWWYPTTMVFPTRKPPYVADVCHPFKQHVFSWQWCRWCDLYIMFSFVLAIPNCQLVAWQAVSSEVPPACRMAAGGSQLDRTGRFKTDPDDPTWQILIKSTFCKYMFCLFVPSISFCNT